MRVCQIRTICLNLSTDLDAIWQIHFWGPITHCVRCESLTTHEKGDLGSNPQQNVQLQIGAKPSVLCCHLANTNEELGGLAPAIPPFAKLLSSLFFCMRLVRSDTCRQVSKHKIWRRHLKWRASYSNLNILNMFCKASKMPNISVFSLFCFIFISFNSGTLR